MSSLGNVTAQNDDHCKYFMFITKRFIFIQVDLKLLVTFIYSFPKLDVGTGAGYRNIYSTERLGCIAIVVKSGYCIFFFFTVQ